MGTHVGADEPLSEQMIDALATASAHPHDPSAAAGVETIQTHISHVYLTRDRVYKLRKAVTLPFLSFATRAERNTDCLREVSLNRRLAPDVYIGVAPLRESAAGEWEIGLPGEELTSPNGSATPFEHVVVMRRLPQGHSALDLVAANRLAPEQVDAVADMLVAFHAANDLGAPAPYSPSAWLARSEKVVTDTFGLARESGCDALDPGRLAECEKGMKQHFDARRADFERRRITGRAVDGHGDLHLDHVFFEEDSPPIAIDCIEFNEDLRRVDVAAELAFFAMDLAYRDRCDLAERFVRRYAARSDDFDLYHVIDYHVMHRALVRAAVAGVAAMETEIGWKKRSAAADSARDHLALVRTWLHRASEPALILLCGKVGTGKSTVAEVAADVLGGAVISSDVTRKRLAGLNPEQRATASANAGIYTPDRTRAVYRALLERAAPVLESGRAAVLDATYSKKAWRDQAQQWAVERGYPSRLIEVTCADEVVLERLAQREKDPRRVSDAGPALFAESARGYEEPDEWPAEQRIRVEAHEASWRQELKRALAPGLGAERPGS